MEAFLAVSFALLLLPTAGVGAAEGPPELSGIWKHPGLVVEPTSPLVLANKHSING